MKKPIYKFILKELSKSKTYIFIMLILTAIGAIFTSIVPNTVGKIVDVALIDKDIRQLTICVLSLLVFLGIGNISVAIRQYLSTTLTADISRELTKKIYGKIVNAKYCFFTDNLNGDILQRVTKDINSIQELQIDSILGFCYDVVLAIFSMIMVLNIYWPLGVIGLAIYGAYLLPTRYMAKVLKKYSNVLRNQSSKLKEMVIERVQDINQIKIYGTEDKEYKQICIEQEIWGKCLQKKYVVDQSGRAFPRVLDALIPAIVFIVGGYQLFIGTLSVGNLVAITVYLPYLNKPIKSFSNIFFQVKDISGRLDKVGEYIELSDEKMGTNDISPSKLKGKIEFRNVSVVNERGTVIDNVTFKINPGEHVAIVGESGAGKSTILKLITQLVEPTMGEILIDDIPLQKMDIDTIRKYIGNILQDTFIFSGSIESNLKYLNPLAKDSEIEKLLEDTDLKNIIENLPSGYQTEIGENGLKLSGGQRQRLGIVRAMIRPMDILLMDEATSALDISNEMKVHSAIMDRMNKKTCIYTAHRLETVVDADQILVFKNGRIVEHGTHKRLLEKDGYYNRLWVENSSIRKKAI